MSSVKKISNNTSQGNVGFTVEFFKNIWNDLDKLLVKSINYSYSEGEKSATQKQGVLTCISKDNKVSASIACDIKTKLGIIANEEQTGFLPGRLMSTHIRLLYDI